MRLFITLLISLLFPATTLAGLSLLNTEVYNGGVAVLRWEGGPLSFGVVRFAEQVIYLYPDSEGAIALLPVGLDLPEGEYPLHAAVVDMRGRTTAVDLQLDVLHLARPLESLTLPERMVSPDAKSVERIKRENARLDELFGLRSARYWTHFERPVDAPVSSVFGKRRRMNGKAKSPHSGTDFRSPAGTPVRSISNGRVALVEDLFYTGQTVVVDHGEGLFSLYAHLSEALVDEGHELLVGEVLGKVGSTGRSTGAHLHLSVRLLGERVDPLALMAVLKE